MKKLILILSFTILFLSFNAKSQSGYLGSTFNVSANVDMAPVITSIFDLNSNYFTKVSFIDTTSKLIEYKKLAMRYQFNLGINKVVTDKIQLGFSYGYQKFSLTGVQLAYTDTVSNFGYTDYVTQPTSLVSNVPITNTSFAFKFKMFYSGLAPIGKYWGFNLEYSSAKTEKSIPIQYIIAYNSVYSSFFKNKYKINDNAVLKSDTLSQKMIKAFNIKFTYGRTIPITEKLGIDLSLVVPLLKVHFYNFSPHLLKQYPTTINLDKTTNNGFYENVSGYLRINQRYMFNIGIRYFI
jgi:hypothetical protein